ncbi:MAG TPA: amidohydrolase family protein [Candidatus Acidoferrales bacterium]|nr:amidohydrolase family protein [Candidatus Acidoferrales bacterium]
MFRSRLFAIFSICSLLIPCIAFAQAPRNDKTAPVPAQTVVIACQNLWDGRSDTLRHNVSIVVQGDRIEKIVDHLVDANEAGSYASQGSKPLHYASGDPNSTCMPGLVEAHTHVLLQGDITAADYDEQILKQSVAFRTILAVRNAKRSLQYGFTTIRDLETEGAGYADVDLKKAINQGIVPGPRMFTSGRAMDVTGAYPVLGYAWELQPRMPKGVQEVDGVEGARKAVREQLSYGVDWIKVYSDRSYSLRPDGVLDDIPTFTVDELRAIVDEAHRQRHKVASHATALNGVHNSVVAGVDSVEHGDYIADEDLAMMKQKGIYYVPTLFVGEYVAQGRGGVWPKMIAVNEETIRRAMKSGVKIAFGTDVGGFDWSITPAKQFATFVKLGMTPKQAIQTSTLTGAELVGMADQIGTLEPGKLADIISVPGNPLADVTVLERVSKTWKGGVPAE